MIGDTKGLGEISAGSPSVGASSTLGVETFCNFQLVSLSW